MASEPRKPTIEVPPGACDTHMHVYYAGHPVAPTAVAQPPDGPPEAYRAVQRRLGFERVVVVQPSAYGFDNEPTLRAMRDLAPGTRGVAVVGPQTADVELERLTRAGIRGARFFMLPGGALPWEQLAATAARVHAFGWHVQLQMDGRLLPERIDLIRRFPGQVVIDHNGKFLEPVGADHPGLQALHALLDTGRVWIKCSAPYETSKTGQPRFADVSAIARGLIARAPERMLWATNWPHPGQPKDGRTDEAMLLDLLADWAPDAAVRKRILVDNPAALYGF
jgi:D-galactarolactone isomerase